MLDILIFAGFAVCVFTFGICLWALGQWLRSEGYGPQLDKLDRQYTALQLRVSPIALSAACRMLVGAQGLNRLPFLGSKNNATQSQQMMMAIRAAQDAIKPDNSNNR